MSIFEYGFMQRAFLVGNFAGCYYAADWHDGST